MSACDTTALSGMLSICCATLATFTPDRIDIFVVVFGPVSLLYMIIRRSEKAAQGQLN